MEDTLLKTSLEVQVETSMIFLMILFGGQGRRGGGGFGSVFENLFGGGGGRILVAHVEMIFYMNVYITLEDVLHGKQIELDLQKYVDCPDCRWYGMQTW